MITDVKECIKIEDDSVVVDKHSVDSIKPEEFPVVPVELRDVVLQPEDDPVVEPHDFDIQVVAVDQ